MKTVENKFLIDAICVTMYYSFLSSGLKNNNNNNKPVQLDVLLALVQKKGI